MEVESPGLLSAAGWFFGSIAALRGRSPKVKRAKVEVAVAVAVEFEAEAEAEDRSRHKSERIPLEAQHEPQWKTHDARDTLAHKTRAVRPIKS